MKAPVLLSLLATCLFLLQPAGGQSLQPSWGYTYSESEPGKQIVFYTPLNSGSDGSVAFVVTRGDGAGSNLENQIFWLRPNEDGSSPATPIWVSGWTASSGFTDIVAVRRNHLVYSTGRELRSVTLDAEDGTPTVSTVKAFAGAAEGGDPLVFTVEQARTPGFLFSIATREDKRGFTLSSFQFTPAPPSVSAVPTFTSVTGGNLSISFRTELGVNYQLQSSTTLTAESWQNIGGVIAGNGQLQTLLQPSDGEPRLFFRVVAL
jgi:hypothetical protein